MKVGEIIREIEKAGWCHARTKGSHRQFTHPTRPGIVTVAGHTSDEIDRGTLNSIRKQAGLKE